MNWFFLLYLLGCGAVMFAALVVARREVRAANHSGTRGGASLPFSGARAKEDTTRKTGVIDISRAPRLLELNPRLLRA